MHSLRDIPVLENIPVLVRAALNVPIENGNVVNDYRLRRAVPTIEYLTERRARVILISHIGDKGTETLEPVAKVLSTLISGVSFLGETVGERARAAVRALEPGKVLVLENLRRDRGEKDNDHAFAQKLAELADVFVQDCFDTSHRPHASIIGVTKLLPSYGGLLLEEEIKELSNALSPKSPSLAVIGGSKFSTKETVLTKLLEVYDHVFIGGALSHDFLRQAGNEIGASLTSGAESADIGKLLKNQKIVLPIDALVVPAEAATAMNARGEARVAHVGGIKEGEVILDHGPGTVALLSDIARKAETVLWNGPLGNYENGFIDATDGFARAVAATHAYSVVGGGDTVAAIEKLGLLPHFSFVSTGGGAMLDFLARGTLPGIEALQR